MKRILVLSLCIILLLSGCGTKNDQAGTIPPVFTETVPAEVTVPVNKLTTVSVPASTETFYLEDDTELFSYSYQHMDMIYEVPDVADKIILEFLNRVDASRSEAENILQAAQNDYASAEQWFPYFYRVLYSPARIDGAVLSLSGLQNSFTGGQHGNLSGISVNYDMMTGDVLTFGSIMHADATVDDFVKLILQQLTEIKDTYYLYDDYEDAVLQRFSADENLYEDFYFTTTGLCFYFSPYEIAPYSSGIITVELPYSALPGLIYDGYFPPERERIEGVMSTSAFMQTDMEQFNNMAEVVISAGEDLRVVYPTGTVEDVRITMKGDGMTMPDYTIFAAQRVTDGDAIVLHVPEGASDKISISYNATEEVTIGLSE